MMRPESEAELAEMVAGATGPLAVQGGGTRGVRCAGDGLSVSALSGVTLHEPGALTLVAASGTPVAEIEALLSAEGQRLAFEPSDYRRLLGSEGTPTVGGLVAANISGPRRIAVGACRDFLLGVRFVDGAGQVIRNGGRVMKNVTGYDLVKLMAGSWGTLGVLTEVSLKVLPVPETEATLVMTGLTDSEAVKAMSAALGSPFEVTGAAHYPEGAGTLLRLEGFADQVAYRAERLAEVLEPFGAVESVGSDASAGLWRGVRDVAPFHDAAGDVWRISVRPSEAAALAERIAPVGRLYDWGGGLIWLLMPEGADLRARAGNFDGHATLIRASEETRARLGMFQPKPGPVASIEAGLRARFDPRGLFNKGLMDSPAGV